MRKNIFWAAMIFILSCIGYSSDAQVSVHLNFGQQPVWGPTGYSYVRYYYIPDIDAYYDVANRDYIYMQNGQWVTTTYLPSAYANFDIYHAYKVVMNDDNPWRHHDRDWNRYYSYRGHRQELIRDSRDHRYWENPEHPMHDRWNGGYERGHEWGGYRPHEDHDRGEHRGWDHDRGEHGGWEHGDHDHH